MAREVLVVEDEPDIRRLVVLHLEGDGFRCRTAANGLDALREAKASAPDLVVLDLMLPGLDGYEVLSRLRKAGSRAPVLILTAKGEEADVLTGFDRGADDYVTKPFSTAELLARVRALLRRAGGSNGAERVPVERFGDIEVNPASGTVIRDGEHTGARPGRTLRPAR